MESPNLSIKVFVLLWHRAYFKGFEKQELGFRTRSEKSQLHDLLQVLQAFLGILFLLFYLKELEDMWSHRLKHLQMLTGNIN